MTAITYPSHSAAATRRKPVPWTRLGWVTWRQHRNALLGAGALLGAVAAYLAVMGAKIHHASNAYAACHPSGSAACAELQHVLDGYYGSQQGSVLSSGLNAQTIPFFLLAVPVLIGAFLGAPVLARELESGTFRFAWTQGAGRMRWTLARLVPLAVVLTAAAAGVSLLFGWYIQPFTDEGKTGTFPMQLFGNMGVSFAAWTLLIFALGVFLGTVIRRTVTATAITLAVGTVLNVFTMMFLRQRYMAPVIIKGNNGPTGFNDWTLSNWITTPSGARVDPFAAYSQAIGANPSPGHPVGIFTGPGSGFQAWLAKEHYTQWWSYQPGSRWWPFQLIEGGWLLVVSVILLAATVWMVRRRAA
jgi:hypothetical protein